MNTKTTSDQHQRPVVSSHAADKYGNRFDNGDIPLATAWERGVRVEAPDKDYHEARLHPLMDLLMTCKNGVITTVMYASRTRVHAPGKVRCHGCGHPHEPLRTNETCPWCGSTAEAGRSTGAISITRKGGD